MIKKIIPTVKVLGGGNHLMSNDPIKIGEIREAKSE